MRPWILPLLALFACGGPTPSDDKDDVGTDDTDPPEDSESTDDPPADTEDDTEDDGDPPVDTEPEPVDADGDGVVAGPDCDDANLAIHPGAAELCDGIDQDCDEVIDEDLPLIEGYLDRDNDTWGDITVVVRACALPAGYANRGVDCDDNNGARYPFATELCDDLDQDCDGEIDEGFTRTWQYRDGDGDGHGDLYDGGVLSCQALAGHAASQDDCDDDRRDVHPGLAEVCDDVDQDCNGWNDDGLPLFTAYVDADGDGWGDAAWYGQACRLTPGWSTEAGDCDDGDPRRAPDHAEVCDGVDSDCDEDTPFEEGDWSLDGRPDCLATQCTGAGMSWGANPPDAANGTVTVGCHAGGSCDPYVGNQACNDALPIVCVEPGADEPPTVPSNWTGMTSALTPPIPGCQLTEPDSADGVCQAWLGPTWRAARFHDGGGWSATSGGDWTTDSRLWVLIDDQPANCYNNAVPLIDDDHDGSFLPDDCDDADPTTFPGAEEVCDGVDNDCDAHVPSAEQDRTGDGLLDCLPGDCANTGMTFAQGDYDAVPDVVYVSCHGDTSCDPYVGDAACGTPRPMLCVNPTGAPNPGIATSLWFGGEAAITGAVSGCQLTSEATAHDLCAAWFGPGWRMASFHDGTGWSFYAHGDFSTEDRMWVHINNQPADCWE